MFVVRIFTIAILVPFEFKFKFVSFALLFKPVIRILLIVIELAPRSFFPLLLSFKRITAYNAAPALLFRSQIFEIILEPKLLV